MFKLKTKPLAFSLLVGILLISLATFAQETAASFSLEEAQKFAIENSYMSQAAKLEVQKSEKRVDETIGTGLPQISATGSYQQYLEVPVSLIPSDAFAIPGQPTDPNQPEFIEVFFGTEQQMGASLRADQLIFDGSYFVGLQAAKVYLELSKNDLNKSDIEVKNMVTTAYGNVLIAEKNVEILKGNVKNLEQSAFETKQLYQNGFVEEQDKDQVALTLANVKNSYENALRMIDISKNQLKFVLGVSIETELTLTDNLETVTVLSNSAAFAESEFKVENHIDYQIVNTQMEASELLWKQQKSTALPRLSAFYSFQTNAFSNEFDFLDNKRFFSGQLVGLNLNVPIFSGLSRMNRIQQAKIDVQKTEIAKKQVEQQLKINAENAKSEYTFALSQYNTSEDNLELAQRIYNRTKIKYDEGINSSLELTTANNQLLETQGNYIRAAFQLIQAKSNLDKALNK